ncbi:hypothetical protein CC78DRAFT_10706, partial [Lojkania enalia]
VTVSRPNNGLRGNSFSHFPHFLASLPISATESLIALSATLPPAMKGKKRARDGNELPHNEPQPQDQPSNSSPIQNNQLASRNTPKPSESHPLPKKQKLNNPIPTTSQRSANPPAQPPKRKLPRLPKNATISKRPLLHPPIPHPHTSSAHAKTLYITAHTPFIPTVKRVRTLLSHISARATQSQSTLSNLTRKKARGRLNERDVERRIADAKNNREAGKGVEKVFLKATGRAITRALEVGVYFQGDVECVVKVEVGSVRAIEDIEVRAENGGSEEEGSMNVDGDGAQGCEGEGKSVRREEEQVQEVLETRIRSLSSITVAIGLK